MNRFSLDIGERNPGPDGAVGELLSLEESAIRSVPLRVWRAADLAGIGRQIAHMAGEWQRAWGLATETQSPDVRCESLTEIAARGGELGAVGWQAIDVSVHGVWWAMLSDNDSPVPLLSRALFGEPDGYGHLLKSGEMDDADRSVAETVAGAAWADWCKRLGRYAASSAATLVERQGIRSVQDALSPWSGSLLVTIPWCGRSMSLLIGRTVADKLMHPSPSQVRTENEAASGGLVPVPSALSSRSTRLQIELATVEIDLGTLLSLQVGDVVRTDHALSEALIVTHIATDEQDASPICKGFLGKSDGVRAVELLPGAPPSGLAKLAGSAASSFRRSPNGSRHA